MNTRALRRLFDVEMRLFLREPFAVFFTLLFPLLLLFFFGQAFGDQPDYPGFRGFDGIDVFVPQLVAQVASYLGFMGIPIAFAEYREMGVLRRYQVSPLRLGTFLSAHLLVTLVMLAAATSLIMGAAAAFFHLYVGGGVLIVLAVLGGAACMFSIGVGIAAVVRSARTAQAAGAGLFFPMLFLSGVALPRENFPPLLVKIGDVLPMTRVVDVISYAWVGKRFGEYEWVSVVIMVAYGVGGLIVAKTCFRWD